MSRKNFGALGVIALSAILASSASAQVTLSAKTSFGGGDGWLTVAEANTDAANNSLLTNTILETSNLTRGMAFNRSTGNLVLVNRSQGININILSGTTGNYIKRMSNSGISGGSIFTTNMAGVNADGQIFVGNLSNVGGFKVYRWDSEASTDASTTVVNGIAGGGQPRFGDSFDVTGTANNTTIITSGSGNVGYTSLNNSTGSFVETYNSAAGTVAGDFRLGLTFGEDANTVFGTAGTNLRKMVNGVLDSTLTVAGSDRLMDVAFINGFTLLAIANTATNNVSVYDLNNFAAGPLAIGNLTTSVTANSNGTGAVAWGAINGGSATLYVMNTNNGIQAFDVEVIPEPMTMGILALGAAALAARKRRRSA